MAEILQQLRLVVYPCLSHVYPIFYRFFLHPWWLAGFLAILTSTEAPAPSARRSWDKKNTRIHINLFYMAGTYGIFPNWFYGNMILFGEIYSFFNGWTEPIVVFFSILVSGDGSKRRLKQRGYLPAIPWRCWKMMFPSQLGEFSAERFDI